MKLYDCATAPSPKRVRMFIAEKGIDVPVEQVDLRAGAQFEEAFRSINPRCTVPALALDDGSVLCDTRAITLYLEDLYPDPPLLGRTRLEKAKVEEWRTRIEQEGFMAVAEAFRNSAPGFKDSAITGPVRFDQIPELAERGRVRLAAFWSVLDEQLSKSAFVAGENFSAADIDAFIVLGFAARLSLGPRGDATHISAWAQAMSARPSAAA